MLRGSPSRNQYQVSVVSFNRVITVSKKKKTKKTKKRGTHENLRLCNLCWTLLSSPIPRTPTNDNCSVDDTFGNPFPDYNVRVYNSLPCTLMIEQYVPFHLLF